MKQQSPIASLVAAGRRGLPRAHSTDRGFTLIELMIVVILIGIMTAMIIPEMKGTFQDALLRSTGRKLVEALNLANSRAVSLNRAQKVIFDRRAHRYTIEGALHDSDENSSKSSSNIPGGKGEIDPSLVLELQRMDAEPAENGEEAEPDASQDRSMADRTEDAILFYPDGTADATDLLLRDRAGYQIVMRINPITARVQVIDREQK